jgi:hypothetical protein
MNRARRSSLQRRLAPLSRTRRLGALSIGRSLLALHQSRFGTEFWADLPKIWAADPVQPRLVPTEFSGFIGKTSP